MSGANKFICPYNESEHTFVNCDYFEGKQKSFITWNLLEQGINNNLATALGLKACEQGYQKSFWEKFFFPLSPPPFPKSAI